MDILEFVEKHFKVELLEPQKELLRKLEKDHNLYMVIPSHHGLFNARYLTYIYKLLMEGLNDRKTAD